MYRIAMVTDSIPRDCSELRTQCIVDAKGKFVAVAVSAKQAEVMVERLNLSAHLSQVVVTVSQGRNTLDLLDQTAIELLETGTAKGIPFLLTDTHRQVLKDVIDDPNNIHLNDNLLYLEELLALMPTPVRDL